MKQTAVVKELRFVQMPIENCFYVIPSVANLSFGAYVPIAEQLRALGEWADLSSVELTSDDTLGNEEPAQETEDTDPLLALAGTLEWNDISGSDDDSLNTALQAEIRVKDTGGSQGTQSTDPLLALAGTLECDVTDIGERHDDYIRAALLAELRGNNDE